MLNLSAFEVFSILMVLGGIIVWFVRLEGRVKQIEKDNNETQKDVDVLRVRHEALDSKMMNDLTAIREALGRIEGYIFEGGNPKYGRRD